MIMATSKSVPGVNEDSIQPHRVNGGVAIDGEKMDAREAHEVFQKSVDGVEFRTVSW